MCNDQFVTCLFFLISLWLYTTRCLLTVSPCRLTLVTSTNWSSFSNHLSGAMIGKEGGASRVDRNTRKYRPNKVVITGRHKSMWTKRLRCLSFLFFFFLNGELQTPSDGRRQSNCLSFQFPFSFSFSFLFTSVFLIHL